MSDGQRNHRGFNYDRHLRTRGIYGIVFVTNRDVHVIDNNQINIIFRISNGIRNEIIQRANRLLPERTSGLLVGILIRRKSRLIR